MSLPGAGRGRNQVVGESLTRVFEGRVLPDDAALLTAISGDAANRGWLVRAGVVDPPFASALLAAARAGLADPSAQVRGAALQVADALLARPLLDRVVDCLIDAPHAWFGVTDPVTGGTLAQGALRFVERAAPPGHPARARVLRAALPVPEVRVQAWRALGADDPAAVLPHLATLLTDAPGLADELATRLALLHLDLCEPACVALADAPESVRRAFANPLERHLKRIFAIKRWVACRRALFGR